MSNVKLDAFANIDHPGTEVATAVSHVGRVAQALAGVLGNPPAGGSAASRVVFPDFGSGLAQLQRASEYLPVSRSGWKLYGPSAES